MVLYMNRGTVHVDARRPSLACLQRDQPVVLAGNVQCEMPGIKTGGELIELVFGRLKRGEYGSE